MPKTKRTSSDFLKKVSRMIKVPPVLTPKSMRKLVFLNLNLNLIFTSGRNNFKRLKHYNYGFIQEYQFSPCNSPLIAYTTTKDRIKKHKKTAMTKKNRDLCSMLYVLTCLGLGTEEAAGGFECCTNSPYLEVLGSSTLRLEDTMGLKTEEEGKEMVMLDNGEDGLDGENGVFSVDEEAERFIEKFYQQMRLQRRLELPL